MFPAIISSVYGFLPFPLWSGFEGSPLIYGNQPTGPRLYRSRSRSIFDYVELELTGCQPSPSLLYSQRCYHFGLRVLLTLKNSQPVFRLVLASEGFRSSCPDKVIFICLVKIQGSPISYVADFYTLFERTAEGHLSSFRSASDKLRSQYFD